MKRIFILTFTILFLIMVTKIYGSNKKEENAQVATVMSINKDRVDMQVIKGNINKDKQQAKEIIDSIPEMPVLDISLENKYQQHIFEKCMEDNWSFEYLIAMSYVESSFNTDATNDKNKNGSVDGGLFQINSFNYEWISKQLGYELDVYDPIQNIDAAFVLLNYLRDKYSYLEMSAETEFYFVTLAYNIGETRAFDYISINGCQGSEYVEKVLKVKEQLERYGTINEEQNSITHQ